MVACRRRDLALPTGEPPPVGSSGSCAVAPAADRPGPLRPPRSNVGRHCLRHRINARVPARSIGTRGNRTGRHAKPRTLQALPVGAAVHPGGRLSRRTVGDRRTTGPLHGLFHSRNDPRPGTQNSSLHVGATRSRHHRNVDFGLRHILAAAPLRYRIEHNCAASGYSRTRLARRAGSRPAPKALEVGAGD